MQRQMNKEVLSFPSIENPFTGDKEAECQFWRAVKQAQEEKYIPHGYGLQAGELNFNKFDESAIITVGRQTEQSLILPAPVWEPRLVLWVQSLEIMYRIMGN